MNNAAALLLIDIQQGFKDPYWGRRNNPKMEETVAKLLSAWRRAKLPVFHVQHLSREPLSPLRPGQPGAEFMPQARPKAGETVVQKHVNSAFIRTDLERRLHEAGIRRLVIAGLTTDHCVSTTTRMASNLGFAVTVVEDATATFVRKSHDGKYYPAAQVHELALASLHGEFAEVVDAAALLDRLDKACVVKS